MSANFITIDSLGTLDALFERSYNQPVVIFKHSIRCGISSHLKEEMCAVETDINLVVVQTSREISDAVESRTGFRHQSPQAFVIQNGQAVYHASHYGIDPIAIGAHLVSVS